MKLKGITIIIALFAITQSTMAQIYEKSKVIESTFNCKEGVELKVINKYGHITINTWEKDKIKISATIIVRSQKDLAQDKLDYIDVRFIQSPKYITAQKHIIKQQAQQNFSYSITYQILVPKYTHLNIGNYNGGTYINNCNGNITSNSKYGNISLNNINAPRINIIAHIGNINIQNSGENTKNIDIHNKYGNLFFEGYYDNIKLDIYTGNIDIQNKNSDASKTNILSKYGYVTLNGCSKEIYINAYSGNIKLAGYTNSENTNINSKYGNITLSGESKNITIDANNGSVDITNKSKSTLGKIIIANRYGQIKYIGGFTTMILDNYNGSISVKNTGDSGESASINTQYGNIKYLGYAKILNLRNRNGNIDIESNPSSKIENLVIFNAYGHVKLNDIENINIASANNDTYNILNSNSITIQDAKYTSFNIDGLKDNFIAKHRIKFGEINIKRIDPKFKKIEISSYYATISLSIMQINDYAIDISGKFGKFKIDKALKSPYLKIIGTNSTFKVTQEGVAGKIAIDNQYGDIRLEKEEDEGR